MYYSFKRFPNCSKPVLSENVSFSKLEILEKRLE